MDRLCILLLVDEEGDRLPIHLLFHILLPVAIHAEKDGDHDPLVAVQIGLTMALPTEFFLRFHDFFICQSPAKRWRGGETPDSEDEKKHEEILPDPPLLFFLWMLI